MYEHLLIDQSTLKSSGQTFKSSDNQSYSNNTISLISATQWHYQTSPTIHSKLNNEGRKYLMKDVQI